MIEPCGDLCSVSSRPGMWGLVNDAGVFMFGDVELASMETYKEVADVNLWGTVRTTKAFLPLSEGPKVNWKGTFNDEGPLFCLTFSSLLRMEIGLSRSSIHSEAEPCGACGWW